MSLGPHGPILITPLPGTTVTKPSTSLNSIAQSVEHDLRISMWMNVIVLSVLWVCVASAVPAVQSPLIHHVSAGRNVSFELYAELEELSRIVDISYCVGTTGIQEPFQCASRCQDFVGFELVTVGRAPTILARR